MLTENDPELPIEKSNHSMTTPAMIQWTKQSIKLVRQAYRNNQPAENYLLYRNCETECDRYLNECLIILTKPVTPQEKEALFQKKLEQKRLEKEERLKEKEILTGDKIIDLRKLNYRKKKTYADEFDPKNPLDPWY